MNEILDQLKENAVATGGSVLAALLIIAAYLPKLTNHMKGDKIEGNMLTRLAAAEKKIIELSDSIHEHAIDNTLAQMMIIKMYHAMRDANLPIPPDVQDYVEEMMERHTKKKEAAG